MYICFLLPQTEIIFQSANLWFYFVFVKDFSSKRSKESEKLFFSMPPKEEKKKQVPAHKGFRIPKKVIFMNQIHRPQDTLLLKDL